MNLRDRLGAWLSEAQDEEGNPIFVDRAKLRAWNEQVKYNVNRTMRDLSDLRNEVNNDKDIDRLARSIFSAANKKPITGRGVEPLMLPSISFVALGKRWGLTTVAEIEAVVRSDGFPKERGQDLHWLLEEVESWEYDTFIRKPKERRKGK